MDIQVFQRWLAQLSQLSAKLDARHVREALTPLIDSQSVLCTDGVSTALLPRHEALRIRWCMPARGSGFDKALSTSRT